MTHCYTFSYLGQIFKDFVARGHFEKNSSDFIDFFKGFIEATGPNIRDQIILRQPVGLFLARLLVLCFLFS